jgi:hypothetical protein
MGIDPFLVGMLATVLPELVRQCSRLTPQGTAGCAWGAHPLEQSLCQLISLCPSYDTEQQHEKRIKSSKKRCIPPMRTPSSLKLDAQADCNGVKPVVGKAIPLDVVTPFKPFRAPAQITEIDKCIGETDKRRARTQ